MPRDDMAAKLDQVRGAGEFTANVLESVHALAQEQIDGGQYRDVDIAETAHLCTAQQRETRFNTRLDVQFHGTMRHIFIEVTERCTGRLILFEFPAAAADGSQMIAATLKNAPGLVGSIRLRRESPDRVASVVRAWEQMTARE